ncbi:MAG: enoyl-CoA hydratase/isomerase family protein [Actinomycetota bacterium]
MSTIRSEPGEVWRITLDRPEARNAVTEEILEDLAAALGDAAADPDARVEGAALGAGCQLLVACDLAVAAEDARIGVPSAPLGIVIPFESIERLVLAVRPRRAADLLITGREVSGREAEGYRLAEVDLMAADALASEDLAEGLRARRERRPPRFRGT